MECAQCISNVYIYTKFIDLCYPLLHFHSNVHKLNVYHRRACMRYIYESVIAKQPLNLSERKNTLKLTSNRSPDWPARELAMNKSKQLNRLVLCCIWKHWMPFHCSLYMWHSEKFQRIPRCYSIRALYINRI